MVVDHQLLENLQTVHTPIAIPAVIPRSSNSESYNRPCCLKLLTSLLVTSFNISGQPNLSDIEEIKTYSEMLVNSCSMPSIYAASIVAQQIGENELKLLRYTNEQLKQLKEDCERIDNIVIQT